MKSFGALATLIASAAAITITFPPQQINNPIQYNNGTITVTWNSVNTDPTALSIVLSANNGQSTRTLATNIPTSDEEYTVDLKGLTPGPNYAINLARYSPDNSQNGILAQSGTFTIARGEVATVPTSSSEAAVASSTSVTSAVDETSSSSSTGTATGVAAGGATGVSSRSESEAESATSSSAQASGLSAASGSGVSGAGASATASGSGASGSGAAESGSSTASQTRNSASSLEIGSFLGLLSLLSFVMAI